MDNVDVGEPIPYRTRWWDEDGAPVEPSAIVTTIDKPDGTTLTKAKTDMTGSSSLTPASTLDVWELELTADVAGLWRFHSEATVDGDKTVPSDFAVLVGVDDATGWCGQWASWDDVTRCGSPPTLDRIGMDLVLDAATEVLFNLSGRRYPGICTVTRSLCFACHACAPAICSCDPYPSIDLGGRYPVWDAWDVKLAGVTLPRSSYVVRGRRWLVRTDGQVWPYGTAYVSGNPDPMVASWAYGRQPPVGARLAAARYANELAKLCIGAACGIAPQSARSVNREGTTYVVLDADQVIAEGRTGIGPIDAWLVADERAQKAPAHIYHPALGASRRLA